MRLKTICSLIPPCSSLADIGCDHAIVSLHSAKRGIEKVYAVDISEKAVERAKRRLYHYKNATAILSDGFSAIPQKVEVAVITGLGGMKIIDILDGANYKPTLVLGAQHDAPKLRQYLVDNGYIIEKDLFLLDRGKYYDFILARVGEGEKL
ncbi:MAG: SAM-dependent methyltransferase, partial [Clostridia bacterium]|nr:SAM-dependent methyltransferase [Clostridia bacterium]